MATPTPQPFPAEELSTPSTIKLAYYAGAAVTAACLGALLPFVTAFCLGRPFKLLVSKRRTVAVNWLLILLATSIAIRTASLIVLGFFASQSPSQVDCERGYGNPNATTDQNLCPLVVSMRLLDVIISMLYFIGASRLLPHMGYAAHARAFLAGGSKEINFTKVDALTVLGWDISHLVLDRWLLVIQVTMVVTALVLDYKSNPSEAAGWSTIPIYKALGLQYGVVHVLNGLLYIGVSIAQRDFLKIVLSRSFCPRTLDLGEEDEVVDVDDMRNDDAFVQLGSDMIHGKVAAEELNVSASVVALLQYRRDKAKERVAGSYAFFGFMTFIAGSLFLIRGILEGLTEVSYNNLKHFLVEPILTAVIPDVVPIICIVEVLLPFGLVSYARACVRPVEVMFGSPGSPPPRHASSPSPDRTLSSTARVLPNGISEPAMYGSTGVNNAIATVPKVGVVEPPSTPSRMPVVTRAVTRAQPVVPPGVGGGVVALY